MSACLRTECPVFRCDCPLINALIDHFYPSFHRLQQLCVFVDPRVHRQQRSWIERVGKRMWLFADWNVVWDCITFSTLHKGESFSLTSSSADCISSILTDRNCAITSAIYRGVSSTWARIRNSWYLLIDLCFAALLCGSFRLFSSSAPRTRL